MNAIHEEDWEARVRAFRAAADAPLALDLFSGCGGMSLGLHGAGVRVGAGAEIDRDAAAAHAANFHAGAAAHAVPCDLTEESAAAFRARTGLPPRVDMLVGGPPCQAYARVGRAKLREVARDPLAFLRDPRGDLYLRWLAWVEDFRPLALVMENVPDALNVGGTNVMSETCAALERMGWVARYGLLNAAHHGVPQTRERAFLVALRREFGAVPRLPDPTRGHTLPRGYDGVRATALKAAAGDRFLCDTPRPGTGEGGLPPAVTVAEALDDLPEVRMGRSSPRMADSLPYRGPAHSAYASAMRCKQGRVTANATRDLPRDGETFARMPHGGEYPAAVRTAEAILSERAAALGYEPGTPGHADAMARLRPSLVPPYDVGKFPARWWKLDPERPSRTLLAHLGKDGYTHIHHREPRVVTVREAARLQGFPDTFLFPRSMNASFRQIGNAVPPPVARIIAAGLLAAAGRRPR